MIIDYKWVDDKVDRMIIVKPSNVKAPYHLEPEIRGCEFVKIQEYVPIGHCKYTENSPSPRIWPATLLFTQIGQLPSLQRSIQGLTWF